MYKKRYIAFIIIFFLLSNVGLTSEKVLFRYKFKKNGIYFYDFSMRGNLLGITFDARMDIEETVLQIIDNGKKAKVKYRFTSMKVKRNGQQMTIPTNRIREIIYVISNRGKVEKIIAGTEFNNMSNFIFPEKSIEVGYSWKSKVNLPKALLKGKKKSVFVNVKFKKLVKRNGRRLAYFTFNANIKVTQYQMSLVLSGNSYFDFKAGNYVQSYAKAIIFSKINNNLLKVGVFIVEMKPQAI